MFDDWAYREHVATPPPEPVPSRGRPRTATLVQSVAHAKPTTMWTIPAPQVHRRANSIPRSIDARANLAQQLPDYPWGHKVQARLNDAQAWLNEDHFPPRFSADLFEATVAPQRSVLAQSASAQRKLISILAEITDSLAKLDDLEVHYNSINSAMKALKSTTDSELTKQSQMDKMHADISEYLQYYDTLETITRTLNKPGTKVAGKIENVQLMLRQIDDGLQFCRSHPNFKDMDLYELRYKQCLTRLLTLTQDFVSSRLRTTFLNIKDKLSISSSAASALIWTKFEWDAAQLKDQVAVLQSYDNDPEYKDLLGEVQQLYFQFRGQLVAGEIQKYLPTSGSDLLTTFNSTLSRFKELYDRERQVYNALFGSPKVVSGTAEFVPQEEPPKEPEEFYDWLVYISEPFYDTVRGYIIRETNLENLRQVLIILQPDDHRDSEDWSQVTDTIYQDAQNRLVFRADIEVESISKYQPTKKDLQKPIYPTVETAVQLLSQVSQLMKTSIFNDLTHKCVRQCLMSLDRAHTKAELLFGPLRASLFHIQQLTTLQSRILEFNVENSKQLEVDFSGIQALLDSIRRNGPKQLLSFGEFLDMAWTSVPVVVEQMFDSMEELYNRLQEAVEDFKGGAKILLLEPILKNEPRSALEDTRNLRGGMSTNLGNLREQIADYITDTKVADALLETLQDAIVASYADYYMTIYNAGTPEQVDGVMDGDTFATWMSEQVLQLTRRWVQDSNPETNGNGAVETETGPDSPDGLQVAEAV